jgi:hypothetical protein
VQAVGCTFSGFSIANFKPLAFPMPEFFVMYAASGFAKMEVIFRPTVSLPVIRQPSGHRNQSFLYFHGNSLKIQLSITERPL